MLMFYTLSSCFWYYNWNIAACIILCVVLFTIVVVVIIVMLSFLPTKRSQNSKISQTA